MKERNQKNKNNKIKKIIGKLHLWFGLLIGSIVFIISITGALYVFKDEIEDIQRKEFIYHKETNYQNKEKLGVRTLEQIVHTTLNEKYELHWVNIPIDKSKSYRFFYFERDKNAWNYFEEYPIYKAVYVNPYSGKILQVYDEKNGFFNIVKMLHWGFLLNSDWGKWVTGIPVLIFVFMLISGIILWWPKNIAARKQRLWFKWKNIKNWKRKNYDLHNIIGFYTSIFALLFSITGLYYAFVFIQTSMYVIFSGGNTTYPDFSHIKTKAPLEMRTKTTLDKIGKKVEEIYPDAYGYSLDLGNKHIDGHKHENFEVYVQHLSYSYHKSSSLIFDENSGDLLHTRNPKDKNFGEKVINANYDIHVGAILGLPTKILAFIVSLLCASLPVTGFLIWYGKNNKAKKKTVSKI